MIEDLHWADPSSRDILRFLLARLRNEHLLVIGTYRTDDLHRRHPLRPVLAELIRHPKVDHIELPSFTRDELAEFSEVITGMVLPDADLQRVLTRSEGNAYFAQELLECGTDAAALPGSLSDVLHARLERLDPSVHRAGQDRLGVRSAGERTTAVGRRLEAPPLRRTRHVRRRPARGGDPSCPRRGGRRMDRLPTRAAGRGGVRGPVARRIGQPAPRLSPAAGRRSDSRIAGGDGSSRTVEPRSTGRADRIARRRTGRGRRPGAGRRVAPIGNRPAAVGCGAGLGRSGRAGPDRCGDGGRVCSKPLRAAQPSRRAGPVGDGSRRSGPIRAAHGGDGGIPHRREPAGRGRAAGRERTRGARCAGPVARSGATARRARPIGRELRPRRPGQGDSCSGRSSSPDSLACRRRRRMR